MIITFCERVLFSSNGLKRDGHFPWPHQHDIYFWHGVKQQQLSIVILGINIVEALTYGPPI